MSKIKPKDKFAEWLLKAKPDKDRPYLYHDPKIKFASKRAIVNFIIRTKLNYRHFKTKHRITAVPDEVVKAHNLKFEAGNEPVLVFLISKKKKQ